MLKVDIHQKSEKPNIVMVQGNIVEITSEVAVVINTMFTRFNLTEPSLADAFRHTLTEIVALPDSPIWENSDQIGICIPRKKREDTDD